MARKLYDTLLFYLCPLNPSSTTAIKSLTSLTPIVPSRKIRTNILNGYHASRHSTHAPCLNNLWLATNNSATGGPGQQGCHDFTTTHRPLWGCLGRVVHGSHLPQQRGQSELRSRWRLSRRTARPALWSSAWSGSQGIIIIIVIIIIITISMMNLLPCFSSPCFLLLASCFLLLFCYFLFSYFLLLTSSFLFLVSCFLQFVGKGYFCGWDGHRSSIWHAKDGRWASAHGEVKFNI